MNDEIKNNIISVLTSLRDMLSSDRMISAELKSLNDSIMENVSLFRDQDSISVSILVYSLYKIYSKNSSLEKKTLHKLVKSALDGINNEATFRTKIRSVFDHLKKFDKNLDTNILQIIKHVQVKNGLKMYGLGISIGQASETIGVSKWEIMDYLGSYDIVDKDSNNRIDPKTRLHFTQGLFK